MTSVNIKVAPGLLLANDARNISPVRISPAQVQHGSVFTNTAKHSHPADYINACRLAGQFNDGGCGYLKKDLQLLARERLFFQPRKILLYIRAELKALLYVMSYEVFHIKLDAPTVGRDPVNVYAKSVIHCVVSHHNFSFDATDGLLPHVTHTDHSLYPSHAVSFR